MKKIDGIEIINLQLVFYCIVEPSMYDLGAVALYCEDRNFILDIVSSTYHDEDDGTVIICKVEVDEDTFTEGETFHLDGDTPLNYKLKAADFMNPKFYGTVYIGDEYEVEPESQTLMIKHQGGLIQAVELELE